MLYYKSIQDIEENVEIQWWCCKQVMNQNGRRDITAYFKMKGRCRTPTFNRENAPIFIYLKTKFC